MSDSELELQLFPPAPAVPSEQRSTIVTSQMPVDNWHELIGDPTLADAILDRLVHNAYRINLKGESMRKQTKKLTTPDTSD